MCLFTPSSSSHVSPPLFLSLSVADSFSIHPVACVCCANIIKNHQQRWRWQQGSVVQHLQVEQHQVEDQGCRCHGIPSCKDFRRRDASAGESTHHLIFFACIKSRYCRLLLDLLMHCESRNRLYYFLSPSVFSIPTVYDMPLPVLCFTFSSVDFLLRVHVTDTFRTTLCDADAWSNSGLLLCWYDLRASSLFHSFILFLLMLLASTFFSPLFLVHFFSSWNSGSPLKQQF